MLERSRWFDGRTGKLSRVDVQSWRRLDEVAGLWRRFSDGRLPPPGGDGLGCRIGMTLRVTDPELSPIPPAPKVRSR